MIPTITYPTECPNCEDDWADNIEFKYRHVVDHDDEFRYQCGECNTIFLIVPMISLEIAKAKQ